MSILYVFIYPCSSWIKKKLKALATIHLQANLKISYGAILNLFQPFQIQINQALDFFERLKICSLQINACDEDNRGLHIGGDSRVL